jgi:hypothetical protein
MALQENTYEITLDHFLKKVEEEEGPENQDRPWSKDKQWSLVVFEEGPPAPYASHTRFMWATSPDSFVDHYREAAPGPAILSAAKLTRVLERYAGIDDPNVTLGKEDTVANRGNFEALEQLDVVTGLLDYAAMGPEHAERLKALYREAKLHPFGDDLDIPSLVDIRNRLLAELNLEAQS